MPQLIILRSTSAEIYSSHRQFFYFAPNCAVCLARHVSNAYFALSACYIYLSLLRRRRHNCFLLWAFWNWTPLALRPPLFHAEEYVVAADNVDGGALRCLLEEWIHLNCSNKKEKKGKTCGWQRSVVWIPTEYFVYFVFTTRICFTKGWSANRRRGFFFFFMVIQRFSCAEVRIVLKFYLGGFCFLFILWESAFLSNRWMWSISYREVTCCVFILPIFIFGFFCRIL